MKFSSLGAPLSDYFANFLCSQIRNQDGKISVSMLTEDPAHLALGVEL